MTEYKQLTSGGSPDGMFTAGTQAFRQFQTVAVDFSFSSPYCISSKAPSPNPTSSHGRH
ncbi:hypothetical protein BDZ97DRAFT_1797576 [Flammula alnicola]|nr:hypothetical protein BDZ97DRAFT_1797576 [Flammula alnicola]